MPRFFVRQTQIDGDIITLVGENISINDERFASSAKVTVNNEGIFIIDEKSKNRLIL